ncbi:MAG TPA: type II restriction endonuclease [Opitutaceae bacterium]|jgi:type II restriction enzyme
MQSPIAEQALRDALNTGKAILKFISRNDVGDTGGHQCGFYLPRHSWEVFTTMPPTKGKVTKTEVKVVWSNGRETNSIVTWYGGGTRREYRLTRFGKDFPFLDQENVGSLLVIVPVSFSEYHAYVVDTDEDIETIQTGLGVEILETVAIYRRGEEQKEETENECLERHFRESTAAFSGFPTSRLLSDETLRALDDCIRGFRNVRPDKRLMTSVNAEYRLFRMLERKLCSSAVTQAFRDIDDFLGVAQTILQRRKGRAGLSFQNHFETILRDHSVSFSAQPVLKDNSRPDFIMPSLEAYQDPNFPREKVTVLALKTTCRDRWRQVLEEATDVPRRHILTLQPGISVNQLRQMHKASVSLVVPQELHKEYNVKDSGIDLLTVEGFIRNIQRQAVG